MQLLDDSKVIEIPADAPRMTGEGRKASYTMPLSSEYDEIENIGDGYFIATKFPEAAGIGLSMLGKLITFWTARGNGCYPTRRTESSIWAMQEKAI